MHDLVIERIQFDKIPGVPDGGVNDVIIIDPLPEILNCCFLFKVIEFGVCNFSQNTGRKDFRVIIDTFDKKKRVSFE